MPYRGYQRHVNAGISNVFAAAAYRFGHSMVAPELARIDENGNSLGGLPLQHAFFNPSEITAHGIDPLLRGLASQVTQRYDVHMVGALRNHLFGPPGSGGFDLASLNLQRGRDHGLPGYNRVRLDFRLRPVRVFAEINGKPEIRKSLQAAYQDVNRVDMWIGGLAEKPVRGAIVGRTVGTILKDQFERLRDGDRFWYEIYLPRDLVKMVKKQTLGKIIQRNTNLGGSGVIQDNVFLVPK